MAPIGTERVGEGEAVAGWVEANREPLLRRWLALAVEQAPIEELAERPVGERLHELELMLDALRAHAAAAPVPADPPERELLELELERRVAGGGPFALALLALPRSADAAAWAEALEDAAGRGERVVALEPPHVAALVPAASRDEARALADRLRVAAWSATDGASLPEVGIALFPDDGDDPDLLLASARAALPAAGPGEDEDAEARRRAREETLRLAFERWASAEHAAAGGTDPLVEPGRRFERDNGDGDPPTRVTPLHPR